MSEGHLYEEKDRKDSLAEIGITLPCVVKPCCGGSSIGVSIVKEESNFTKALDDAFFWEDEILIEEYVEGREFSVGVIKGRALPVIEIAPKEGFYDYKISIRLEAQWKPVRQILKTVWQKRCRSMQ